jgi:hypothetical protein
MYLFHSDPGHGWLQVKRQELKDLRILDKISHCSYQKRGDVFLEEDCDYSLFVERMKELGRPFEIKEINSQAKDSIVRSYEGFTL